MLLQVHKEIVRNRRPYHEIFVNRDGKRSRLRFPVRHSELNSVELIQTLVKSDVERKSTTFKMIGVKMLVEEWLENATRQN